MGKRISSGAIKRLWARSGGVCYYPDCDEDLIRDDKDESETYHVGEQAHIHPHSENGGPRSGGDMPTEKRREVENFILLCPTHHREIDKAPDEKYPVERLLRWKKRHEKKINRSIQSHMPNISQSELDVIIKHLLQNDETYDASNKLTSISNKVKINNFSDKVTPIIKTGLTQSTKVEDYLNSMEQTDSNFATRLASYFTSEYRKIPKKMTPDDAFMEMLYIACHDSHELKYHAAGAAIVVYFFEKCDIFKK